RLGREVRSDPSVEHAVDVLRIAPLLAEVAVRLTLVGRAVLVSAEVRRPDAGVTVPIPLVLFEAVSFFDGKSRSGAAAKRSKSRADPSHGANPTSASDTGLVASAARTR